MGKKCVECGGHVPPYQNFLCEECWRKALNEKLDEDDREETDNGSNSSRYRRGYR